MLSDLFLSSVVIVLGLFAGMGIAWAITFTTAYLLDRLEESGELL